MARFKDETNEEIRRTLRSAIQKVRRAEKRGEKGLPEIPSVREFKQMFTTERDAKKELKYYKRLLNNKTALERHRTKDGTVSNWEYSYIVNNLKDAKLFVNRELFKARERLKTYPDYLFATKAEINKLEDERDILNRNLASLSAQGLKTVGSVIRRQKRQELKTRAGRVYFMRNLDYLLQAKGTPLKDRKELYEKLEKLSNEEFLELYRTHDIVSEIMILIPSEGTRDLKSAEEALNQEGVKQAIEDFQENIDGYIFDASTQTYISNQSFLESLKSGDIWD